MFRIHEARDCGRRSVDERPRRCVLRVDSEMGHGPPPTPSSGSQRTMKCRRKTPRTSGSWRAQKKRATKEASYKPHHVQDSVSLSPRGRNACWKTRRFPSLPTKRRRCTRASSGWKPPAGDSLPLYVTTCADGTHTADPPGTRSAASGLREASVPLLTEPAGVKRVSYRFIQPDFEGAVRSQTDHEPLATTNPKGYSKTWSYSTTK